MKQKRTKSTLFAFLLPVLLFSSCAPGEESGLSDGKYPITFTAQVDGLTATRATTTGGTTSWQENDLVAISMDGGTRHKQYKISNASTGAMSPNDEANILYWSKTQETLAAWYPVSCTIGGNTGSGEVSITDQSSGFGTLENILHAPAKDYTFSSSNPVAFSFRHALAKVKVTLQKGEGITDSDLSGATVRFMGYTAGSLRYDGMTGSGSNGEITPHTETSAGDGSGTPATYTALLIPQQMQNQKFIRVTVGTGDAAYDYYYIPTETNDANLEAGNQYTYTITVKKTGLQVESVTASWNDNASDGDAASATFKIHLAAFTAPTNTSDYKVTNAENQELTASDGVYSTASNAINISLSASEGYRLKKFLTKVTAGICKQRVAYTADTRTYTYTFYDIRSDLRLDKIEAEAETASADLPKLAVGDYYYADGTWSSTLEKPCVGIVFKVGAAGNDQSSNYAESKPGTIHGYVVALTDALATAGNWDTGGTDTPIDNVDNANVTAYTGYSDTQTIINTYSSGTSWDDYQAFKSIVDYRSSVPVPGVSSGWYLPSLAQLGDVQSALSSISTSLATAGAAFKTDNDGRYWTSSEKETWKAWYVQMGNGSKNAYAKNGTDWYRACYARAILTF